MIADYITKFIAFITGSFIITYVILYIGRINEVVTADFNIKHLIIILIVVNVILLFEALFILYTKRTQLIFQILYPIAVLFIILTFLSSSIIYEFGIKYIYECSLEIINAIIIWCITLFLCVSHDLITSTAHEPLIV